MDSLHLPFHFLTSVIPSVSGQEVSLKTFVSVKLPFQTNTIVDSHFPQWNYIPTSGVRSLFFNEFGYPVVVSRPNQIIFAVLHSKLHHEHFTAS